MKTIIKHQAEDGKLHHCCVLRQKRILFNEMHCRYISPPQAGRYSSHGNNTVKQHKETENDYKRKTKIDAASKGLSKASVVY